MLGIFTETSIQDKEGEDTEGVVPLGFDLRAQTQIHHWFHRIDDDPAPDSSGDILDATRPV